MKEFTLFLHQVPKNDHIPKGTFIFLENRQFQHKHLEHKLKDLYESSGEAPFSLLDFWFLNDAKFYLKFGNTMSKHHWKFWNNVNSQFPDMRGLPIAFNNEELKEGGFRRQDIEHVGVNSREITFKYTGKDGESGNVLSCKYDLYIKNICEYGGRKYETKIILDPRTRNNGNTAPLDGTEGPY